MRTAEDHRAVNQTERDTKGRRERKRKRERDKGKRR